MGGQLEREEAKKRREREGKGQQIELRNRIMTDCASVEEIPARHCRIVQNCNRQKTSEQRSWME